MYQHIHHMRSGAWASAHRGGSSRVHWFHSAPPPRVRAHPPSSDGGITQLHRWGRPLSLDFRSTHTHTNQLSYCSGLQGTLRGSTPWHTGWLLSLRKRCVTMKAYLYRNADYGVSRTEHA